MTDERFVFVYKGKTNMEMTREELLDAIDVLIDMNNLQRREFNEYNELLNKKVRG